MKRSWFGASSASVGMFATAWKITRAKEILVDEGTRDLRRVIGKVSGIAWLLACAGTLVLWVVSWAHPLRFDSTRSSSSFVSVDVETGGVRVDYYCIVKEFPGVSGIRMDALGLYWRVRYSTGKGGWRWIQTPGRGHRHVRPDNIEFLKKSRLIKWAPPSALAQHTFRIRILTLGSGLITIGFVCVAFSRFTRIIWTSAARGASRRNEDM